MAKENMSDIIVKKETVIDKINAIPGKVGKLIWDFITDKNNDGDEKRVLGIVSVIIGFVYPFQAPYADSGIMWAYLGFGGALLGIASVADRVPNNNHGVYNGDFYGSERNAAEQ